MKKKILIVDDSKIIHKIYEAQLDKLGFEVLHAYDGMESIQIAAQQNPNLIFLDVHLPKLNGYLTCRILKENATTRSIPIVLQTSGKKINQDIFVQIGFNPKADMYIDKDKDENLHTIIAALSDSQANPPALSDYSKAAISESEIIQIISNIFEIMIDKQLFNLSA